MKLTSTNEKTLNYIRALVYGDSGIGKTTSLGTLPKDRTLIAVCERSVVPLREKAYPVIHVESWDDVQKFYKSLANPEKIEDADIRKVIESTKIIAVDSLSEIANLCIRHILGVDRRALIGERTKDKRNTPENVYADLMTMEDWGLYRSRITNMVSAFCHLSRHVIMTSLAAWNQDKQACEVNCVPNLGGKTAREIPAHFDLVMHMEAAKKDGADCRLWRTFNGDGIISKDASGVLDPFEEANWQSVFKKILVKKNGGQK